MTTAMPDFKFASGAAESKKVEDADRPAFGRFEPKELRWNDDEGTSHIIRPMDDDSRGPGDTRPNLWKGIKVHKYSSTVAKPEEFKGKKWPEGMMAICRHAGAFNGFFPNCIPCDKKLVNPNSGEQDVAKQRMFMRVVVRERVDWSGDEPEFTPGTEAYDKHDDAWRQKRLGKLRTYRDKLEPVQEIGPDGKQTGNKIQIPMIRYVDQSHYLYFKLLVAEAQGNLDDDGEYTVLNRDFVVTKEGKERQTSFNIRTAKFSDQLKGTTETVVIDGEEVSLKGVAWDLNDPRVLAYYEQFQLWDLGKDLLVAKALDSWHEKWFVPGGFAKHDDRAKGKDDAPAGKAEQAAAKTGPQPAADDEQQDFDEDDDEAPAKPAAKPVAAEEKPAKNEPTKKSISNWREKLDAGEQPVRERTDSSGIEQQAGEVDLSGEDDDSESFQPA